MKQAVVLTDGPSLVWHMTAACDANCTCVAQYSHCTHGALHSMVPLPQHDKWSSQLQPLNANVRNIMPVGFGLVWWI
jgi:hypothetical protein